MVLGQKDPVGLLVHNVLDIPMCNLFTIFLPNRVSETKVNEYQGGLMSCPKICCVGLKEDSLMTFSSVQSAEKCLAFQNGLHSFASVTGFKWFQVQLVRNSTFQSSEVQLFKRKCYSSSGGCLPKMFRLQNQL